jgi:hypothetical protein
MTRSEFLQRTSTLACGACAALVLGPSTGTAAEPAMSPSTAPTTPVDEALQRARYENEFTNHWLTDLFDTIEAELDRPTQLKLIEGCGRGCFRRHKFKQDIAEAGKGDVDQLVEAYRKNFGISREGDLVHIRYGGGKCFCPAARNRPARPNDLHCECTRATHETIFATALGRPIKVELVETVRRGGKRCHLVAHLA